MREFITKWPSSELVKFKVDQLKSLDLDDESLNFLATTGLPVDAAPFLTFEPNVSSINDSYQINNSNLNKVFQVGSDGAGDRYVLMQTIRIEL